MGVKLFKNSALHLEKINDSNSKKKQEIQKQEKGGKVLNSKRIFSSEIDISSNEIMANYALAGLNLKSHDFSHKIPNGHSRYEYKGGRFDIYRNNDKYKSQFVYPKDYDTKEFIEKFPELENQKIIQTDDSSSTLNINGEIDEIVSQSSLTGDCWLLASVISMSQNEVGKEIIKNSITVNDDNTTTVSFKGIGVSYTLTQDEIKKYDTDTNTYDGYSNGDNDMLVLELATEKLWKDINSGKVKLDTKNKNITYSGEGSGIEDGGLPSEMIYYLTGIESDEYYNDNGSDLSKNQVYKILDNALKSDNTVLNIGIYDNIHSCTLVDGSTFTLDVGSGGHALAVTKITDDTVTFVNPWDSTIEYSASWSEFASLGIGYISSSDLDEAIEKETVDMTNSDTYFDYGYDFNYDYRRRGGRNYDFDFNRDKSKDFSYDEIEFDADNNEIKPDFNHEDIMPDFNNDDTKSDIKSNSDIQNFIMELLGEFMNLFKSLFNLLWI